MYRKSTSQLFALAAAVIALAAVSPALRATIISLDPDDAYGLYSTSTTILTDEGVGAPAAGADDDQWGFANNAAGNTQATLGDNLTNPLDDEVWVARTDQGENVPLLTTTISGLDDSASYNIYIYYVVNNNSATNWGIRAGAQGQPLTTYLVGDGTSVDSVMGGSGETLMLLQAQVLANVTPTLGQIALDIDQSKVNHGDERSFFKGIGIELIPEPATLALMAFGSIAALVRRPRASGTPMLQ